MMQIMYRAVADYLMLLEDQKILLVGRIHPGGSKRIDAGGSLKSTNGMVRRLKTQSGRISINLASDRSACHPDSNDLNDT